MTADMTLCEGVKFADILQAAYAQGKEVAVPKASICSLPTMKALTAAALVRSPPRQPQKRAERPHKRVD